MTLFTNQLLVNVLPTEGPKITGGVSKYRVGDTVYVNCTSSKSKPAATLRWYINDELYDSTVIVLLRFKRSNVTDAQNFEKYSSETAPNASTITLLVQWFRDIGSVADRKRSGRASIVKMKVAHVETVLRRSPLKRPTTCINIITEFTFLLKVMKGTLCCSKMGHITGQYASFN
ncbi:UNVERIFIED_CONTAM: cadm2 [Trichonephila clavipes]